MTLERSRGAQVGGGGRERGEVDQGHAGIAAAVIRGDILRPSHENIAEIVP